jgi:chromosome partitioning protein
MDSELVSDRQADAAEPRAVIAAAREARLLAESGEPAGSEKEAIAVRGDGEVRRGLGWPEATSADTRSQLSSHGSSELLAVTVTPPIPASVETSEVGLGWPGPSMTSRGQHVRRSMGAGDVLRAGRTGAVSRETSRATDRDAQGLEVRENIARHPGSAGGAARGADDDAGRQRGGSTENDGGTSEGVPNRDPRSEVLTRDEHDRARIVPRHAVVDRPAPGNADLPIHESRRFADRERPEEMRVWAPEVEGSSRGGWTFQGSDSPMISGTYPGGFVGRSESEDEVAIPEPDPSADTPIARAAQAAMKARAGGQDWPRPEACRILTIANQKGGVGKTTTAVNLAASLAMNGSRVLVVDLDPQGNASTALDVEHRSGTASIYNVLVDGASLTDVIRPVQGYPYLFCAPATIDLAGAEIELVPLVARESRLARAVTGYDSSELDYIFIDCPPSLGLLTVNALVAAPEVLIPIQCEYYALEGLEQLLRTIDLVRSHLNPTLTVSTILLTMYDSRTKLASQVADEVRGHFGELVLNSVIPRSVRVSEAPSYGQSVMTYDPGSSGALAYLEAAREMAFQNKRAARA